MRYSTLYLNTVTKAQLFLIIFISSQIIIGGCSKPDSTSVPVNSGSASTILTTLPVVSITANSAASGGNIASASGNVTERGLCWNTSPGPTIANSKTIDGTGTGFYISTMTGLSLATTYYVKAYATNNTGTVYGNELSFTTLSTIIMPTVTTTAVTSITSSTAISGGFVGLGGGAAVTARGVCWSTLANPTIADTKTSNGIGLGDFISNLTNLTENTLYHVRAYATNSAGTAYGNDITFTTPPIPEPGTVYIGSSNNNFYALNVVTGQLKWKYTGTAGFSYGGPCYANGKVYAGGVDSYLYCMDTLNGNVDWRFLAGNTGIESDPVYDNGTIYFGSNDDYLYALDANTGNMKWRFLTGANVSTSPTINNGVVFFGSSDSKVYAVNTLTGQLIWSYQTAAMINQSSPTLANGLLYVGSRDGYLYALNMNTGTLAWRYLVGLSLESSSPTVVNNIVYIGANSASSNGGVYAINATTGQLIWVAFQTTAFNSSPIIADGQLFITSASGDLLAMDAATGLNHWSRTLFTNGASPAVMNGVVYVGGGGMNYIYAIDAINGNDKWRFSITNGAFTSGPCIVTSSSVKYSGDSGMQN